jgi:hypothetical protein
MKKNYLLPLICSILLIFFSTTATQTNFKEIVIRRAAIPGKVTTSVTGIHFQRAGIYAPILKKITTLAAGYLMHPAFVGL